MDDTFDKKRFNSDIDSLIRQNTLEQLQKFDTNSWLELYKKLDERIFSEPLYCLLAEEHGKKNVRKLIAHNNTKAFAYLYGNTPFPKEIAAQITDLARQTAQNIRQKKPKLFSALSCQYRNFPDQRKHTFKQLRNYLSLKFYGLYFSKMPKIKENTSMINYGHYDRGNQTVIVGKSSVLSDVFFHEFFHHLNNVAPTKGSDFLRKNRPASQLMSYSLDFYLYPSDQRLIKAYKRQPTEFGAHLFNFQFSRELNRLINREQQLANAIAVNTSELLDSFSLSLSQSDMNKNGALDFSLEYLNEPQHRKLSEICRRLLHTEYRQVSESSGAFTLPVNEVQNAVTSESLHRIRARKTICFPGINERRFLPDFELWLRQNPDQVPEACNRNEPPQADKPSVKQKLLKLLHTQRCR